jgi:hypothetical protein
MAMLSFLRSLAKFVRQNKVANHERKHVQKAIDQGLGIGQPLVACQQADLSSGQRRQFVPDLA